ncbi:hypothetical protein K239x_31400 [Planctomycetes bacterium K23_9]|uniref:Uncharacterized protein n=1 Tax=Stieleria marina TaxID=1930275 RepID=A0A517NVL6_9BACT|nr:hypothetical protein K239x_31400 [Planctomycetes bacterium K23_9]
MRSGALTLHFATGDGSSNEGTDGGSGTYSAVPAVSIRLIVWLLGPIHGSWNISNAQHEKGAGVLLGWYWTSVLWQRPMIRQICVLRSFSSTNRLRKDVGICFAM